MSTAAAATVESGLVGKVVCCAALIAHAVGCILLGSKKSMENASAETIDSRGAGMFVAYGTAALLGLLVVVKFVNPSLLNVLISIYFGLFGALSIARLVASSLLPRGLSARGKFRVPVVGAELTVGEVVCFLGLGLPLAVWWGLTRHWLANNAVSVSLVVEIMSLVQLDSFTTGALLLGGLFAYDIFFVFGTSVMISVVRGFDAPIKILFPRDVFAYSPQNLSLLGLGDIAIPGLFLALLLRFDNDVVSKGKPKDRTDFWAGIVAYVVGLVVTMVVMHVFHHAQPALLYLVPACLLSAVCSSFFRGHLGELISFAVKRTDKTD